MKLNGKRISKKQAAKLINTLVAATAKESVKVYLLEEENVMLKDKVDTFLSELDFLNTELLQWEEKCSCPLPEEKITIDVAVSTANFWATESDEYEFGWAGDDGQLSASVSDLVDACRIGLLRLGDQ
jgi:hypothetical protein